MSIKLVENNTQEEKNRSGVGANSLDLSDGGHFLQSVGNIVSKAAAATRIVGVNNTETTYASDNQTIALKKVVYVPAESNRTYELEITGGTITVVDETKYYNLADSDTVDGATESLTTWQVELVEFKTATLWVFKIVNL